MTRTQAIIVSCATVLLAAGSARAQDRGPRPTDAASPAPGIAPFQLRGVSPRNLLRLDSSFATYHRDEARSLIALALLSAQGRISAHSSFQVKWGWVDHLVASGGATRTGFVNPTATLLFGTPIGAGFHLAGSLSVGLPIGSGGGNGRDPDTARMQRQAALARSSLDNTTFAVNDVGFPIGASLAYVAHGLTCQVDATLIPSVRVKGERLQPDASKVNATSGFFVGYLVLRELAFGAELRYQRYLSTPASVVSDPSTRDNLSFALGTRVSADLGHEVTLRPALSYARSLAGAGIEQAVQVVQLDLPLLF